MGQILDLFGNVIQEPEKERKPEPKPIASANLSASERVIAGYFAAASSDELKEIYRSLVGILPSGSKAAIAGALAKLLDFKAQPEFDLFYNGLPLVLREAIAVGTFFRFVDLLVLEKKFNASLILKSKISWEYYEGNIDPAARLQILQQTDEFTLYLPQPFRLLFSPWLPKPAGYYPVPIEAPQSASWSNVDTLTETLPLLVEAVAAIAQGGRTLEIARKGLPKTTIRDMRAACGLPVFPIAAKLGLDPINLFTRTLFYLEKPPTKRPADVETYAKGIVTRFFNGSDLTNRRDTLGGGMVEYFAMMDHLTKRNGVSYFSFFNRPSGRVAVKDALVAIGKSPVWYGADELGNSILMQGNDFTFSDMVDEGEYLRLKGDKLTIGSYAYSSKSYETIFPASGRLRDPLLALPLFKAYCYFLAILGVIEIIEIEPPRPLTRNQKTLPISPYDGLRYIRVTDFGAWCVGLRVAKPTRQAAVYEAIADKELLLVAFKGRSLERKLFLEQIGVKLGEDRYRITEASFIRGCAEATAVNDRIKRFRALIDPKPEAHWETFFKSILVKAALFAAPEACWLFTLPAASAASKTAAMSGITGISATAEQNAIRQLLADPSLRNLIVRAEGNRVVIRLKDYRRFMKTLADRGFLTVDPENGEEEFIHA